MAKFNTPATARAARVHNAPLAPITAEVQPSAVNHEGGAGYGRDVRSELYTLAVTNLVGEDTFYEDAEHRDHRYERLVRQAAVTDPVWTAALLRYLRGELNMRTAPIVGAAEFVKARLDAGCRAGCGATSFPWVDADGNQWCDVHRPERVLPQVTNADVIDSVLQRADEPVELAMYWLARYGLLPQPVKKGLGRAMCRLWNEYTLLKYDSPDKPMRWGDLLELVHPRPLWLGQELTAAELADKTVWWNALCTHALDRRRFREPVPAPLPVLRRRAELMALPVERRRPWLTGMLARGNDMGRVLRRRGMTWEALAGWLQGPMDAPAWEAAIPAMPFMARLRNLRNFDAAGVSDEVAQQVVDMLTDPDQVAASRQLPFQFLTAYREAPSDRWRYPLEKALEYSLGNVPELGGTTLVLVDTSYSMDDPLSKKSTVKRWDAATMFGLALARRCQWPDVVSFSTGSRVFELRAGEGLLRAIERWRGEGYFLGQGTQTVAALREHYAGHDRVVIVTDEQEGVDPQAVSDAVPTEAPLYTWNVAGYQYGHAPAGSRLRYTFAGLSDAAFAQIPLLERGQHADWPF